MQVRVSVQPFTVLTTANSRTKTKNNNQESSKKSQELPTKNKIQEPTKELHKSKPSEEGKVLTIKLSISNNDENTKPAENVKTPEKTPSKVSHITPKAPQKVKTPETPKKIMMEKPIEKPEAPPKKIMIEKSDKAEVKPKESKVIPIVQEKPTKEVLKSAKEEKEVKEVKIVKEQPTEVKRVEPKEPIVNTPEKVVPIKREKKPADLSLEIPERPAKKIPIETQFSEKEPEVQESKSAPHRIIPIQIGESSSSRSTTVTSPTPTQSSDNQEMHIPIQIERKASRLDSTEEAAESRDGFSTNSLSRRRFGSRKKRSSFAYSDSSTGTNDEETQAAYNAASNLAGLQKFTSIGKPGTEPMFRLRKTKPPFAAMRSESFSSGEEDDFDDDGFREMTAENLFSTLLTRVKSLTRKIHDDDQHDQLRFPHQNPRMMNHRLNPGNTHAALERTALRSSLKRNNNPLSRQSSMDAYYEGLDDGASSVRSYGSSGLGDTRSSMQRGIKDQETDSLYSIGSLKTNENKQGKNEQQIMKRLGSSKDSEAPEHVSVTSKQRLRPGYLPPPSHLEPNDVVDNSTCRIENALSESGSMRNVGQAVQSLTARKVPITMERVLSNASLASGPSQSELLETISEKEPKRISRVIESVTSPTPRDNQPLPWASSQEPKKSPYKFVQMKRLSVGLDLDDDNRSLASTSSGYFSSQQQNPTQLEARRTKEGQSSKPVLTSLERLQPSTPSTSASFTASNSSSVASNLNVGSEKLKLPAPPSQLPTMPKLAPPSLPSSPPPSLPSSPPPPPIVSKVSPTVQLPPVTIVSSPSTPSVISPISPTPKLTQPIYTPFKSQPSQFTPSKQAISPLSSQSQQPASGSANPFQKQTRSQPNRPYLQIALVRDRQYKTQAALAGKGVSDDSEMDKGNSRRTILPYGGAKSDGLLNKHAFISCNVIAAAERRKRDSYSRSSTTELPLEKVN